MVTLLFFARYREWAGVPSLQLQQAPASLAALREILPASHPATSRILQDPRCIVAVNRMVVSEADVVLRPGDEVAFYPPVTGG